MTEHAVPAQDEWGMTDAHVLAAPAPSGGLTPEQVKAAAERAAARMAFREGLTLKDGRTLKQAMEPFQRKDWEALDSGKYRHAWLGRPRGHSKTGDVAVEAVVELWMGGHERELFCVAGDEDQANILFREVKALIRRDKPKPYVDDDGVEKETMPLSEECVVTGKQIKCTVTGSTLTILSSDKDTALGLKADWIAADEIVIWRGDELWNNLWSGIPKIPGSRAIVITTAGWDRDSVAWKVHEMAEAEANWYFSDLGPCASWLDQADIEQQRRTLPPHTFAMYHLNKWTEGAGAFLTVAEVDSVFVELPQPCEGQRMIGLDLGLVKDRTVLSQVLYTETALAVVEKLVTFYPPGVGAKVDLVAVEQAVYEMAKPLDLVVNYDPHQAQQMAQQLRARGIQMREYTFTAESRTALFQSVLETVRRGALRSAPHAPLRSELLGLQVSATRTGWRADHRGSSFDDHVVSIGMPLAILLRKALARKVVPLTEEQEEARRPAGSYERPQRENITALEPLVLPYQIKKYTEHYGEGDPRGVEQGTKKAEALLKHAHQQARENAAPVYARSGEEDPGVLEYWLEVALDRDRYRRSQETRGYDLKSGRDLNADSLF